MAAKEKQHYDLHKEWAARISAYLQDNGRWVLKGCGEEAPCFEHLGKTIRMADFLVAHSQRPMHWIDIYAKSSGMPNFQGTGRTYTGANVSRFGDLVKLHEATCADILLFFIHVDVGQVRFANLTTLVASRDAKAFSVGKEKLIGWPFDDMEILCSTDDLLVEC